MVVWSYWSGYKRFLLYPGVGFSSLESQIYLPLPSIAILGEILSDVPPVWRAGGGMLGSDKSSNL